MTDLFLRPLFTWRSAVASRHGPKSPVTRHVLLTLSLYMSELGDSCYPSTNTLASASALGLRTVKEHIALAAAAGWIGKRDRRLANTQGWNRIEYFAQIPPAVEAAFHAEQRGALAAPSQGGAPPAPPEGGAPESATRCASLPKAVRHPHPITSENSKRTPRGGGAERRTLMPENFSISDRVRQWAKKNGSEPFLDLHFEHFVGHCRANRSIYLDWDEALMNCIRADWGGVRRNAQRGTGASGVSWWSTEEGICAKGKELGMDARPGESWSSFKGRINERLKVAA